MRTFTWVLFLSVGIMCCKKNDPIPSSNGDVNALLNEEAWSGITVVRIPNAQNEPCGINTFTMSVQNKLPYPKARVKAPATCGGYCPDQMLTFARIPLAVGVYPVSILLPCQAIDNKVGVSYTTISGGDVFRDIYKLDSTKTGMVKITRYDPSSLEVEGTFDMSFRATGGVNPSDAAENVHFRNGSFRIKLP